MTQATIDPFDDDHFHDECGVFGVYGHAGAGAITALGLHALQHRGQEAAGIVTFDGKQFHSHRALGQVGENFSSLAVIAKLAGAAAIGHNRYATTGEVALRNVQPVYGDLQTTGLAICHNGNLTNSYELRQQLVRRGSLFQSTSDTEVILHLMSTSLRHSVLDRMVDALRQVEGAYSLAALSNEGLIGVRDPLGVRPLSLGRLGDSWFLASETVAFDIIGADHVRDVEPGEIVLIDQNGVRSIKPFGRHTPRFCVFEHIYFARPDSVVDGRSVYEARKRIGEELARESPVEADAVIPVPDSGVPAALGFAEESGLPFELGIIRNHYIGRTFIEPTDQIRNLGVKLKHNANRRFIDGKRIVLVDDSIVRGTTSLKIVEMMRNAGATEVHMRVSSPPTSHSCFYGIATPERDKLLASQMSVDEMAKFIGADSLAFISTDGLYRALGEPGRDASAPKFCDACFTGDYPIPLTDFDNGTLKAPVSQMSGGA
jgi:amidophosphoribosyltransferase